MRHYTAFYKPILSVALLLASTGMAMADELEELIEEPAAPTTSAAEAAPAAAGDEGDEDGTSGFVRLDGDAADLQVWVGATHKIGSIELASDVIYFIGGAVEVDVGPVFSLGDLALNPMIGVIFDFGGDPDTNTPGGNLASLVAPQLYTIWENDTLYFESWALLTIPLGDGEANSFYTRDFLLYKLYDQLQVGGQLEATYAFGDNGGLASLPIGLAAHIGYGQNNTLGVFLGYETEKPEGSDGIAGRFTFIRSW